MEAAAGVTQLRARHGNCVLDTETKQYLRDVGGQAEEDVDLTEVALRLGLLTRPGADLDHYRRHLQAMAEAVALKGAEGLSGRVETLRAVIAGANGYSGDQDTYNDLQNANLLRVIDRRKGLPVALSIVYLHVARAQGWPADGMNFPGHFLIALSGAEGRLVADPFHNGNLLEAHDLRRLVKAALGEQAELEPAHHAPLSNRDILMRLQENLRLRLIRQRRFEDALAVVEAMTWIGPQNPLAWRDMGMLHAELGNLRAAVMTLEESLACDDSQSRRHLTAALIQQLRAKLN